MTGSESTDGPHACSPASDEKERVPAEWARLLAGDEIPALELAERLANSRDLRIATAQDAVYDALEDGPLVEDASVDGFGSIRLRPEHAAGGGDSNDQPEQQVDAEIERHGDRVTSGPGIETWADAAFDDPDALGVSYADVSTSDGGVHAMYRDELPDGVTQAVFEIDDEPFGSHDEGDRPTVEIYDDKHVCIATGDHVPGTGLQGREWDADALENVLYDQPRRQ